MFFRVQEFPIAHFQEIEARINGLLRDTKAGRLRTAKRAIPAIEMSETDSEYIVTLEAPGMVKSDVKVSVKEGVLTISSERKPAALPEDARWLRNEIPTGGFSRTVRLPGEIDSNECSAELKNGMLVIRMPKSERMKPREIKIQ